MFVFMYAPAATRASTAAMTMYLQSSSRRNKMVFPIDSKVFRHIVQGVCVCVSRQSAEQVAGRRRVEPKEKKKLEESLLLPVH
jgi:hypothetical protein